MDAMKLCRKLGGRLTLETPTRGRRYDAAMFNNAEACAWLCEQAHSKWGKFFG